MTTSMTAPLPSSKRNGATARNNEVSKSPALRHSIVSFRVAAFESSEPRRCFRDAIRFHAGWAMLVILDFAGEGALNVNAQTYLKFVVRAAATRSPEPDAILREINGVLSTHGQRATASCAVLDANENLLLVSSAGASSPWIVRGGERVVRVLTPASIELGRVNDAAFPARRLHFDRRDAFILPSAEWAARLDGMFATKPSAGTAPADWLRACPERLQDGCALCLTFC